MIVKMWMTRNLMTVTPHMSITEAATLMAKKRIRRLPVVVSQGSDQLVGILFGNDLYQAFPHDLNPFSPMVTDAPPSRITVDTVMNRSPITTTPDTPIEEVAGIMATKKVGALPVVHDGRLVGLITESDVFRAFVGLFELTQDGARITFDLSKRDDIFEVLAGIVKKHRVRVLGFNNSKLDSRPVCVVRVEGQDVERFIDDLWKSKHPVLNVLRTN